MPEVQVEEGRSYRIAPGKFIREECCNCGFCHLTQYRIVDKHIEATTYLDPFGTRKAQEKRRKP